MHDALPEASLLVPGSKLLFIELWVVDDEDYLVAGTVNGAGLFSLYRYHDADGDARPDKSTEVLLFQTTFPAYVTSISREVAGSALYALDRRCQDVWKVQDTDSDGWADTIAQVPFARSADFPALVKAKWITVVDVATIHAYEFDCPEPRELHVNSFDALELADTNADGVAESEGARSAFALRPYVLGPWPFQGQMAIELGTEGFEPGLTAEVWLLSGALEDVSLLGSGSFAGAGNDNAVAVALSTSLSTGDHLGVRFSGRKSTQGIVRVRPAWPQITGMSPWAVPAGSATSVVITGANLSSAMSLEVLEPDGTVSSLSFQFDSSTQVSATLPAMEIAGAGAGLVLHALAPGQPAEDAIEFTALVCDPELLED